jgi:hypothetical protein
LALNTIMIVLGKRHTEEKTDTGETEMEMKAAAGA